MRAPARQQTVTFVVVTLKGVQQRPVVPHRLVLTRQTRATRRPQLS